MNHLGLDLLTIMLLILFVLGYFLGYRIATEKAKEKYDEDHQVKKWHQKLANMKADQERKYKAKGGGGEL